MLSLYQPIQASSLPVSVLAPCCFITPIIVQVNFDLQERLQRCAFRCKDAAEESLSKTAKDAEIKKAQARIFGENYVGVGGYIYLSEALILKA